MKKIFRLGLLKGVPRGDLCCEEECPASNLFVLFVLLLFGVFLVSCVSGSRRGTEEGKQNSNFNTKAFLG